jgi:hypothetical protein
MLVADFAIEVRLGQRRVPKFAKLAAQVELRRGHFQLAIRIRSKSVKREKGVANVRESFIFWT